MDRLVISRPWWLVKFLKGLEQEGMEITYPGLDRGSAGCVSEVPVAAG